MPLRELVEYMLGVTGKDEARIRELLLRGTLVSGASRFRWAGWEAEPQALRELLAGFPDPEPSRPFTAERCVRAILRGGRQTIEIPREAGLRKSFWRRSTFWKLLMDSVEASAPHYVTYSYKDHADIYQAALALPEAERLRSSARLLTYTSLRDRVAGEAYTSVDLYTTRS
jgi:hypothetical protein